MDFLESALRSALLKDGAHLLEDLLEDLLNDPLYKGQEQEVRPGEKCYRDRAKTVETLFGEVRLLRDYHVAGDGSSRVPLDESLGLIEGYSPGLAKMMVRMAAQDSFEEGSEDFGILLRREAFARGFASAQKTVYLGSGVVEAGCKTVVGKRLKNSGMFWSVKGAQNVLDLRTFLLSNRFDDLWLARDQKAA
ncbi:MAG: hypothetical protein WC657_09320 [Candidatus Paceibacterota bacterium]|jgi:hypothetical protein